MTDVDGRDANIIANLNDVLTASQRHDNRNWNTIGRQMKDMTHSNFGKDLIQMCQNCNMRIMNGYLNASNTDNFTCYAPLGKSTVDYLLSTHGFFTALTNFEIFSKLVESDHVPLAFSVSHNAIPQKTPRTGVKSPNCERRFQYVFDKSKILQYREALTCDSSQDKLSNHKIN